MMKIKIQTYIRCYGWTPLTTNNISATHCQVFSKSWQKRMFKAEIKIETYIHSYGWSPLTTINISATHCQVFSKYWQEK